MTPRAYWDQDYVLWEEHPTDRQQLRCAWSPFGEPPREPRYCQRWALEYIGLVLVPTC